MTRRRAAADLLQILTRAQPMPQGALRREDRRGWRRCVVFVARVADGPLADSSGVRVIERGARRDAWNLGRIIMARGLAARYVYRHATRATETGTRWRSTKWTCNGAGQG